MDNEFKNWYIENQLEHGGLVSKKTASLLLEIKQPGISVAIKRKNLNIIKYKKYKTEYLSLNEIIKYEKNRYKRKEKKS